MAHQIVHRFKLRLFWQTLLLENLRCVRFVDRHCRQDNLLLDLLAIDDLQPLADTFRSIGYPASKVHYLVNRADSAGGIDPDDLHRALGRVPEHRIVSDGQLVVRANNEGVPFVLADPSAAVSQDVARVAGELLGTGHVPATAGRR